MPRRSILSNTEKENLLALPNSREELIKYYTFSECDLSIIKQHRGAANRIGFAVQLCYMRYPGIILGVDETPFSPLLNLVADQLKISISDWQEYGKGEQTRREHLTELHSLFGFQTFTTAHYQPALNSLEEIAWQTDKGILLASALVQSLRTQLILLPSIHVIERICAEVVTKASRRVYIALTSPLSKEHFQNLNSLMLFKMDTKFTTLSWLREPPGSSKPRHVLEHIDRLKVKKD